MARLRVAVVCVWVGLLWGAVVAWSAEAPAAPADPEALKKKLEELKAKEQAIRAKIEETQTKLKGSPEIAKVREAADNAEKSYAEKRKADQAVAAAVKAQLDAAEALGKVVREKVAAGDQGKAVLAELEGTRQKEASFEFEEAIARLELDHPSSPINFALDKDPEILTLRKAYQEPTDKEARDKARKAYDDARKAKKEAMEDAKKALGRIEAARKGRAELRNAEREVQKKLDEARRTLQKSDDADVKAAREKLDAARKAFEDASNSEAMKAARKERDDAREAYDRKLQELLAADPTIAALKKERDEVRKALSDLGAAKP